MSELRPWPRALVPARRAAARSAAATYDHLILGAGCAGLSLAWYLLERGVGGRIALVDRRERFENDRTWCYWDVEPSPFDDLASRWWQRWLVADASGVVESQSGRYHYRCLRSIDFYQRVLDRIAAAPNVDLVLGTPVLNRREEDRRVVVETPDGAIAGSWVFDSACGEPAAAAGRGDVALLQHFLGRLVRARRDAFDPDRPMLMDFRVSQADGPHFVYLLPFSTREALVEDTYLFPCAFAPSRHRSGIAGYLHERHGLAVGDYEVIEEECGRIPMTTTVYPTRQGRRVFPIGLAGGAARPSSGYAFVRIQRQTQRLADLVASGRLDDEPEPLSRPKHRFLDAVFLRVLRDRPVEAPALFRRLFARAAPDAVVRFLTEASSIADDMSVIAALPKWPFVATALTSTCD